jgi:hypothetical protein
VEVTASSLYEAAVLAIAHFRNCGFAENAPGSATRLTVTVKMPGTSHEVQWGKAEAWLQGDGRSPAEQGCQDQAPRVASLLSPRHKRRPAQSGSESAITPIWLELTNKIVAQPTTTTTEYTACATQTLRIHGGAPPSLSSQRLTPHLV